MRSIRPMRPLGVLAALVFSLTAACAPRSLPPQGSATPAPETDSGPSKAEIDVGQPVRVALVVPASSADPGVAGLGRSLANAAGMAAAEEGAGVVDLAVYRTAGTEAATRGAVERAMAEGAALILGPLFGTNTAAAAAAVGASGVKVISFSTDSAVAGDPVYLSGFLPEAEAVRVLDYASRQGIGSVAVYYPDNRLGEAALTGARMASDRTGIALVASVAYPRSFQGIQSTAEDFAAAALGAGAESILLPEGGQGLQTVASFTSYFGISPAKVRYLGLGQWNTSATFGEANLKGGWFPAPDPQAVQAFLWRYESSYGGRPKVLAALGYDAVRVAIELVRDARASGRDDPFETEALTRPQGFSGALGPLRFGADGTAERALAIMEVGDGSFSILEQAPVSFGPGT